MICSRGSRSSRADRGVEGAARWPRCRLLCADGPRATIDRVGELTAAAAGQGAQLVVPARCSFVAGLPRGERGLGTGQHMIVAPTVICLPAGPRAGADPDRSPIWTCAP